MACEVYAFDAYGTLFDVHSAVGAMRERIGPHADRLSQIWRTKQLEYTWVRTLAGSYLDFMELTAQALDFAAAQCGGLSDSLRTALLESYETLEAYPDVKPALQSLKDAGIQTAILSNGTPAMLQSASRAAGIEPLIDHVLSVDALGRYKTVPDVYALITDLTGVKAGSVSFQSSNRWDIAGAKKFGFRPVWVNRTNQPDEYADLPPAHTINDLSQLTGLT
ncbi:MAG: haloacid dehalogenase type II [Hyphomicrobiales bacterium]|nr:haloacid dehalogenase type II [Hyphomicrobiales bacterium]